MDSPVHITVKGASGIQYKVWPNPIGSHLTDLPGIYILSSVGPDGYWRAHYVGQAANLNDRVGRGVHGHHQLVSARLKGATHVAAFAGNFDADLLCWMENDLIQALSPALNKKAPPGHGNALRA